VICTSRPTSLVAARTTHHVLADGTRLLIRPVLYSDRNEIAQGYQQLSPENRRLRFFAAPAELSERDLDYLTTLDYDDHFAWAVFAEDAPGRPGVAVARYIRDPHRPHAAEAAVTVIDAYQHRGIGTLLLLLLVDEARRHGIDTFVSYVLWDNRDVIDALQAVGASVEAEEPGVARVEMRMPEPESPTLVATARAALRHHARAARALLRIDESSGRLAL
jgi:GNAT superfamily N-acetyltransferase